MDQGHFYFVEDQYFIDFPDSKLMRNKEIINGKIHDRPCYFSFCDTGTNINWIIPISSQVQKFKAIYQKKMLKYKQCDTIVFGLVLGCEKAFLIQNMCPITDLYIKNEYIDSKSQCPVRIDGALEAELLSKSKKILALQRKGYRYIFPNVLSIEASILSKKSTQP